MVSIPSSNPMTPQRRTAETHLVRSLKRWKAIAEVRGQTTSAVIQVEKFERMLKALRSGEMEDGEVEEILLWFAVPSPVEEHALTVCAHVVASYEKQGMDIPKVSLVVAYEEAKKALQLWKEQNEPPLEFEVRGKPNDSDVFFLWSTQE